MIRTLHYLKAIGYDFFSENNSQEPKIKNFEELKKDITNCTLCQLCKKRKFPLVEKEQKKVRLFIIGSLAQKSENESGILLNSKNGLILKKQLFESLNLKEEGFYFSYLFKCFSTKIDDFSLQSCLPFLLNEIQIIKPKIILCLGAYALKALGFEDFTNLRGEIFAYKNFFVLASFDIEFIEKNPSFQKDFIEDLEKIKGFL